MVWSNISCVFTLHLDKKSATYMYFPGKYCIFKLYGKNSSHNRLNIFICILLMGFFISTTRGTWSVCIVIFLFPYTITHCCVILRKTSTLIVIACIKQHFSKLCKLTFFPNRLSGCLSSWISSDYRNWVGLNKRKALYQYRRHLIFNARWKVFISL